MEIPQRRIDRVIQRLALAFRKQVRQQAVLHIVRERAQDRAGFAIAAGAQRQPFEADHRVAAPVAEPVIAGVDAAQLAAAACASTLLFQPAARQHDELIRCHRQLLGERIALPAAARARAGRSSALPLGIEHRGCVELQAVPRMRRGDEHDRLVGGETRGEIAGAERALECRIAAIALDAIHELFSSLSSVTNARRSRPQAKRNTSGLSLRRISWRPRAHFDANDARCARRRFVVATKRNERPHLQLEASPLQQPIPHAHRVLVVRHDDGFFEHDAVELEGPHGDAMIEPELLQVPVRLAVEPLVLEFRAAQVHAAASA